MEKANNENEPLVSIALCTFNGENYLPAQLDSIVTQTYKQIEVVIVDDASTDSTVSIIRQFASEDPRIRFEINPTNLGYNKNFEKAFSLCKAEYIAISDQDDIWDENKIGLMMNNWPKDSLMVYCLAENFHGDDLPSKQSAGRFIDKLDDARKVVFGSDAIGHTIIFKKGLLNLCLPFPTDIYYDWWLCMHAASHSFIHCIPQKLVWHRFHEENISQQIGLIKDKQKKQQLLREQYAHLIESFYKRNEGRLTEKNSLLKYAGMLREMDGKHFNMKMFSYVFKNRKYVFHYRKKSVFSHIKHAFRMAFSGLLRT